MSPGAQLQPAWPTSWLVPDWPVPSRVRALCTTRDGGTSTGPWGSLNLGDHVADVPAAVQANRAAVAQADRTQRAQRCPARPTRPRARP